MSGLNVRNAYTLNVISLEAQLVPNYGQIKKRVGSNGAAASISATTTKGRSNSSSSSSLSSFGAVTLRNSSGMGSAQPPSKKAVQRVEVREGDKLLSDRRVRVTTYQEWREKCVHVGADETLVLDLSVRGCPPLGASRQIHLSFPSTLLRRPNFQFDGLIGTLNDQTRDALIEKLSTSKCILLVDEGSLFWKSCIYPTIALLRKMLEYMEVHNQNSDVNILLLQNGTKGLPLHQHDHHYVTPNGNNLMTKVGGVENGGKLARHGIEAAGPLTSGKPKLTLKLKIPGQNQTSQSNSSSLTQARIISRTNASSELFIQSMKGDTLHYSPSSLLKYFKYTTPKVLPHNVPSWLCPFNRAGNDVLSGILEKFELLEQLEIDRLRKCLTGTTADDNYANGTSLKRRMYSLKELQKQYTSYPMKESYREEHSSETVFENSCLDTIGSENSTLESHVDLPSDGKKEKVGGLALRTELGDKPLPDSLEEEEALETPLGNYMITQGIISFTKNRYSNIVPYEHSRVKLEPSPLCGDPSSMGAFQGMSIPSAMGTPASNDTSANTMGSSYFASIPDVKTHNTFSSRSSGEQFSDYFNANYLSLPEVNPKCKYIATQAPLPSTVDDFWKVVTTKDVKVIVSLNSDDELDLRKWDIYWNPDSIEKYEVTILDSFENVCLLGGLVIRVFQVRKRPVVSHYGTDRNGDNGNNENSCKVHNVYQIQYTKWLDSCGIVMADFLRLYNIKNALLNNPETFIEQLKAVRAKRTASQSDDEEQPLMDIDPRLCKAPKSETSLLVHCSAGCGRTGVFITLDFLLSILQRPLNEFNKIDVWNMTDDLIFIVVNEFRKQRLSMVQNLTQYITCYESLLEFFSLKEA